MKVITWNCKMRFRKEYNLIFPLNPDIIVIPECEDKIDFDMFSNTPSDFFWIGDNPNKGLGVITFNNIKIEKYENYSDEFRYILPLVLTKNNEKTVSLIVTNPHKGVGYENKF